jgi:hypothetical protein
MWLGITANLALAVPTLLWPERMLELSGFPAAVPMLWVRFSSLLLILLSAFYVPAAVDCRRARVNAWLAIWARLAGVLFFLLQARQYWLLGVYDFIFFVPEIVLLTLASRASSPQAAIGAV